MRASIEFIFAHGLVLHQEKGIDCATLGRSHGGFSFFYQNVYSQRPCFTKGEQHKMKTQWTAPQIVNELLDEAMMVTPEEAINCVTILRLVEEVESFDRDTIADWIKSGVSAKDVEDAVLAKLAHLEEYKNQLISARNRLTAVKVQ
jgi:hypothetical protein